jgi:hypothetical protein
MLKVFLWVVVIFNLTALLGNLLIPMIYHFDIKWGYTLLYMITFSISVLVLVDFYKSEKTNDN